MNDVLKEELGTNPALQIHHNAGRNLPPMHYPRNLPPRYRRTYGAVCGDDHLRFPDILVPVPNVEIKVNWQEGRRVFEIGQQSVISRE